MNTIIGINLNRYRNNMYYATEQAHRHVKFMNCFEDKEY